MDEANVRSVDDLSLEWSREIVMKSMDYLYDSEKREYYKVYRGKRSYICKESDLDLILDSKACLIVLERMCQKENLGFEIRKKSPWQEDDYVWTVELSHYDYIKEERKTYIGGDDCFELAVCDVLTSYYDLDLIS